jgi:DNA-binding transcriptional LysR family regulator
VPARLAEEIMPRQTIAFELPFRVPSISYSLLWHQRKSNDAAQQWLIEMARGVVG